MATKADVTVRAKELCFRACTDCKSANECDPDEAWIEEARVSLEANGIMKKSKQKPGTIVN